MNYLVTVDMNDDQIKALILNYLRRRKRWNNHYFNTQTIVRYLGQDILGDGKEVTRIIDDLFQDRWLNRKKKGDTISLNTQYITEINKQIKEYLLPEFA